LRCLCYVALTGAVYGSARGLLCRSGAWWGAAGLALALPFAALLGWSEPSALLGCAAVLAVALWAQWRWRAHLAAVARWRAERNEVLRRELDALLQRDGDA
jgi:hypothetical protein